MPANPPRVFEVDPRLRDQIAKLLADLKLEIDEPPHTLVRGKGPDGSVTLYKSGKLVIQGKGAERFMAALGLASPTEKPAGASTPHIGTDESGKGDYFGPLVIAAAYADAEIEARLVEIGVKDSKKLTDPIIRKLDAEIRKICPNTVVAIGPERYNELYAKIGNLNKLLAWGHARVIENLLPRVECNRALTDQFGDESFVRNALMAHGKKIILEQRPRAEADPAVAAASIIARAEFVRRLESLSREVGTTLPKGAGPAVDATARRIFEGQGTEGLRKVAKLHFVTTQKISR